MEIFNAEFFVVTLALVGVVIIIAALLSGLIDSSDLPQVGAFLAVGAMLGPAGLGLLDVTLNSRRLPLREMLAGLFDAFDAAPRPFVVKCAGGQDRTDLVSPVSPGGSMAGSRSTKRAPPAAESSTWMVPPR